MKTKDKQDQKTIKMRENKTMVQTLKTKDKQDHNTIKIWDSKNNGTNHKDKGQTRPQHNKTRENAN